MKIIKLDSIDSTNSFLKALARNTILDNFTTVTAKHQKNGRGQQNTNWTSKIGKNLTISTFVSFSDLKIQHQKYLNFAISLAIFESLKSLNVLNLSIKWPNDILAGNDKIAGILVENTFTNQQIKNTIIGIGLNVNQEKFLDFNRKATSLKKCLKKTFDLKEVLHLVLEKLQTKISLLNDEMFDLLEAQYLNCLYKKNIPTTFKNSENVFFMGIIKGISSDGKLQITLKDDSVKEFGIKEVSFA